MTNRHERRRLKVNECSTCAICLQNVDCNIYAELPCKHQLRGNCLFDWYKTRFSTAVDVKNAKCFRPFENKEICFYHAGVNCISCPLCRTEYTRGMEDSDPWIEVKGKLHIIDDDGERITHYITSFNEFMTDLVPFNERKNNVISPRWNTVLYNAMSDHFEKEIDDFYLLKTVYNPKDVIILLCLKNFST